MRRGAYGGCPAEGGCCGSRGGSGRTGRSREAGEGGLPPGAVPEPGRAGPPSWAAPWVRSGGCERGLCAGAGPPGLREGFGGGGGGRTGRGGCCCRCLCGAEELWRPCRSQGLPQWVVLFRACSCHRVSVFYPVSPPGGRRDAAGAPPSSRSCQVWGRGAGVGQTTPPPPRLAGGHLRAKARVSRSLQDLPCGGGVCCVVKQSGSVSPGVCTRWSLWLFHLAFSTEIPDTLWF